MGPVTFPPLAAGHPAYVVTAASMALVVLVSVTYQIFDTDLWQHLTVGRAIWTLGEVPARQLWSWPTYGTVDTTSSYSWLFRALIWPIWSAGGTWGLFAWRWITTLAAFLFLWLVARRLGARGLAALGVLALAALTYRQRAQVRPETLAAVLLAIEVWILETRRHAGPDRSPWLVLVLWVWVNAHVSWVFGVALLAIHLALGRGPGGLVSTRRLALAGLAAIALAFVNPYGWRALWQPLDFALHQRHEPIFANLGELMPPQWRDQLRNALPLLVLGWPILLLRRAVRRGIDWVETSTCLLFSGAALTSVRFLGLYALVAAPYVARDLAEALAARHAPHALAGPWRRAAVVVAGMLVLVIPEWTRPGLIPAIGIDRSSVPVGATDFMAAHDVRGRGFTPYGYGGWLLWRFWPERDRLPFMDIHQSGTPEIRRLYQDAYAMPLAWAELDRRYRLDYVLLRRAPLPGETLIDRLDADTTWALVFLDDAAALWVRRDGPLAALARERAYHLLPAGSARLETLSRAWIADSSVALALLGELDRQARESPWNASAWNLVGYVVNSRGDRERAREAFTRAVRLNEVLVPGAHAMLARIALHQGRPRDALRELGAERRVSGARPELLALEARARDALRNPGARDAR